MNVDKKITEIKGIGENRAKAFARSGVDNVGDLLLYFPRAYQNRGAVQKVAQIKSAVEGGNSGPFAVILTVASEPKVRMIRRGITLIKLKAFDDSGICDITYFNQNFLKEAFHTGAAFRFWGKFSIKNGRLESTSPIFEPYIEEYPLPPIVPVYPLTSGLTQKIVSSAVAEALRLVLPETVEYFPYEILSAASLPNYAYAIKNIHIPESVDAIQKARKRFVFDEVFFMSIAAAYSNVKKENSSVPMTNDCIDEFLQALPYELTGAQKKAVEEIIIDMTGKLAMNRILTGDVGSGKTVVAAAAAYVSLKNGYDALFMAPTEILANQHTKDLAPLLKLLGYEVLLLTGSVTKSERKRIITTLGGDTPVLVIGTHALLSDDIKPFRLGLIIIDEQHRFGAIQRAELADKCAGVNTLSMSATPIPRTLSFVMYGGLDVSHINELPAGRQPVDTFIVNEGYRSRLNGFIKKQVDEGRQVYVVCPSIDEVKESEEYIEKNGIEETSDICITDNNFEIDDGSPLKAAKSYAEKLSEQLPGVRVNLVHGKMKNAEREATMSNFRDGKIDVLVSTTVIEVGVNVPNATLMIVENAERFGLSQLHQLRGRVGRGSAKSYFILVSDSKSERSRERLLTVKNNKNGYAIAEADLRQRGPGDFFSEGGAVRQHGIAMTLAAKCTDVELISLASELAKNVISSDPDLSHSNHKGIRDRTDKLFQKKRNIIN